MTSQSQLTPKTVNIAVYGTLREGFWNYDRFLRGNAKFILAQMLPGFSMFGSTIPHIVRNEADKEGVYVEVHQVPAELLANLDRLEGYQEGRQHNTYNRLTVQTEAGEAYIYAGNRAASTYGTSEQKVPKGLYSGQTREDILSKEFGR